MYLYKKVSNRKKVMIGCAGMAASFALLIISRNSQSFSQWYSESVYPIWVNIIGRLAGLFPFSVSELLLYVMAVWIFVSVWKLAMGKTKEEGFHWLANIFMLASMLFFLYVTNCGINYYRESFSESAGIEVEAYSVQELREVCKWLTEEVNARSTKVPRDAQGVMRFDGEKDRIAVSAMEKLGQTYPELSGYYPRPKGLLIPWILSVQQLSGIYSPFTIEANYNSAIVDYNQPFTACHELSHLRGFMQEQEANFIAFLASSNSQDTQFQYSGYLMGWKYCMNVLYDADYEAWEGVRATLAPQAEPDLAANREFWNQYDGKVAEVANKVNDTYLKANKQDDGVKSYDKMVDLIVAYYQMGTG